MEVIVLYGGKQLKLQAETADEAFMLGFTGGELRELGYEVQPDCPTISRDVEKPSLAVYLRKKPPKE